MCVHFSTVFVCKDGIDVICYVRGDVETNHAASADEDRYCD